jgi:hypothetical protein
MGYTVQSSEAKINGHEPVDPLLSKVFDHQEQANEQHRTQLS